MPGLDPSILENYLKTELLPLAANLGTSLTNLSVYSYHGFSKGMSWVSSTLL